MATYLPNVKKYTAVHKDWTPDFKFLSDALQKRQTRYDSNYRKMNNLYGSVVHAELSHDDNKRIRDRYTEQLAPKLQQISGVDFSLGQNVEAAKGLFTPFFDDDLMVRDIVWTKKFNKEISEAQNLLEADEESDREQYWEGGIQRLKWHMDDFKDLNRGDILGATLPTYIPKVNVTQRAIEALSTAGPDGKGMTITNFDWTPDGRYIITTENGDALTHKFEGYKMDPNDPKKFLKDEKGDKIPIYSNPAQNYVLQTMMDDPMISRYYQTKAYVEARRFWEKNAEMYGGIEGAKKVWAQQEIDKWKLKIGKEAEEDKDQKEKLSSREDLWRKYIESDGVPLAGSDEAKDYGNALAAYKAMILGTEKKEKYISETLKETEDIEELLTQAYASYMNTNIWDDTKQGAKIYSELNMKKTTKEDPYALATHKEYLRYKNDAALENLRAANDLKKLLLEQQFTNTNASNSIVDVTTPNKAGNLNANATNYDIDGNVDVIQDNNDTDLQDLNTIFQSKLEAIETYYNDFGSNKHNPDQKHTWAPNGLYITTSDPGQNGERINQMEHFLSWEDIGTITSDDFGDPSKPNKKSFLESKSIDISDIDIKKAITKKIEDEWEGHIIPAFKSVNGANGEERINPLLKINSNAYKKIYLTNGKINGIVNRSKLADKEQLKVYENVYNIVKAKSGGLSNQGKAVNDISMFNANGMITESEYMNKVARARVLELTQYGLSQYDKDGDGVINNPLKGNYGNYTQQRSSGDWMGDGFLLGESTFDGFYKKYNHARRFQYKITDKQKSTYETMYAGMEKWRKDNGKTRKQTVAYFFGEQETRKSHRSLSPGSRGTGGTRKYKVTIDPMKAYKPYYNSIISSMNQEMTSANAIPGETSFNRRTYLNDQTQLGSGAGVTNYYTFNQDADGTTKRGKEHINAMSALISGPEGSFQLKLGDQSSNWTESNTGNDAYAFELLSTYLSDLSRNKDNFGGESKAPGVTVRWNENLGGVAGDSKYGGWVIEFNKEYGEQLYDKFKKEFDLENFKSGGYKLTLFHPEEYGENLNTFSTNAQISNIEFEINNGGANMYQIQNTGGNAIFWKNTSGQMFWKYQTGKWDADSKNFSYGSWTDPIPMVNTITGAPMGPDEIDAIGADYEIRSQQRGIELENTQSNEKAAANTTANTTQS